MPYVTDDRDRYTGAFACINRTAIGIFFVWDMESVRNITRTFPGVQLTPEAVGKMVIIVDRGGTFSAGPATTHYQLNAIGEDS